MDDDAMLLRRFADDGAESALAEVVRRHLGLVHAAALRRTGGEAGLAADVAQRVFARLAAEARAGRVPPVPAAWLFTATKHAAADAVRAEQRRRAREAEAARRAALEADGGVNDEVWTRLRPELDAALDGLGAADRAAVLLRFFEQRSWREIGQALRLGEDAARMRAERALARLRVRLARRGVTSTAAALGGLLAKEASGAAPAGLAEQVIAGSVPATAAAGGRVAEGGWWRAWDWGVRPDGAWWAAGAAAVVLGTVGLAGWKVSRWQAAEAQVAAARAEALAQREEVRRAEQWAAVDAGRTARLPDRAGPAPESARAGGGAAGGAEAEPDFAREGRAFLQRHPAVRAALTEWHTAKARLHFGALARELGLSGARLAEFEELVRGDGFFGEVGAAGEFLWLTTRPEPERVEREARLRALIGDDGWQRYRAADGARGAREEAAQAAAQLFFTAEPMTAAQATELAALWAEVARSGRGPEATRRAEVRARAARFLSPGQIEALGGSWDGEDGR